jgi:signal transduction histidine kinase
VLSDVRDRLGRVDYRVVDAILALAAIVAIELTCWLTSGISTSDRVITAVAAVLFAGAIALRRVWPAVALVFALAVVTVSMPFGGQLLSNDNAYVIPVLVLSYSAGAWLDTRRSVVALGLGLALLWAWALLPGQDGSTNGLGQTAVALFYVTVLLLPTWLVGRFVGRHGARAGAFRELAAQVAAAQAAHDAAAIADERARIGSELQDIIAHSISAMVIQAGSARLLLGSDPGRARESILNVEATGRQALSDVRRLLGMLRKNDDPRALSPQPGLGQLSALIDSLRASGLSWERNTVGDPVDLTPGIDLVAYRVVEAGLRVAADRHVGHGVVTVHYEPRDLELEIRGDRAIPDLDATIAPIAQRVALYDGELRTEPDSEGFVLFARIPLEAAVAA